MIAAKLSGSITVGLVLGVALILTDKMPFRYKRFEQKVLGQNPDDDQKKQLKSTLDSFISRAMFEKSATDEEKIYVNAAGFGRTDALTRIGNQVFAVDMRNKANFAQANAPVRYPQVWDASWFTWVQYNSSISDPLVRNIGEALGVRASAKLYGDDHNYEQNHHEDEALQEETPERQRVHAQPPGSIISSGEGLGSRATCKKDWCSGGGFSFSSFSLLPSGFSTKASG